MFNEIEQLENEIIEFRGLVKDSSELLMQINNNTNQIEQLKVDSGNIIKSMQDREVEIATNNIRIRRTMVLAIVALIVGITSIIINLVH